jgi:hypothetical protein
MTLNFQENDVTLESQWRSIILFGKNSASYKFAFGKALLHLVENGTNSITLKELSPMFVNSILEHIGISDKQGNSKSSNFFDACRKYKSNQITYSELLEVTERHGFENVVDAFQNVHGGVIPKKFYEKDYSNSKKRIVVYDNLLKLRESVQYANLGSEVEARWSLVETAWNLNISPEMLEVKMDENFQTLYLESSLMRRINITSARASLNGYQKGKCFYSFQDISIDSVFENICAVDHFFPHIHKLHFNDTGSNIDGVWNLVLANRQVNSSKGTKIPKLKYLERLYRRNEFYIASKHPLGETIINQTGRTQTERRAFLQRQYNLAVSLSIQQWEPLIELESCF